jgi:serine protease Do
MADSFGLAGHKGAVVADVAPGGPAQKAGLESGDVVVAVNGQPVESYTDMTREVSKVDVGALARLQIFRDGKQMTIDVHTALRPSEAQLADNDLVPGEGGNATPGQAAPNAPILGMDVAPLTPAEKQQFNLAQNAHGVVIEGVKESSDASDKGLQRGDVIVRAGDREVTGAGDIRAAITDWKKDGRKVIPLAITRDGRTLFVPLKIDG